METSSVSVVVPPGTLDPDLDDLVVLGVDGDLDLVTNIFSPDAGATIRLVDHADPRTPVQEGPGPNVVDDVAGFIGGSVVYGECCEPVSGTIYSVGEPDGEERSVALGYSPNISRDGRRFATLNDFGLVVADLASGDGRFLALNQSTEPYRNTVDLQLTEGDGVATLYWTADEGYRISLYDVETLDESLAISLGAEADGRYARFLGLGPDGELAAAVGAGSELRLRFFDPRSLEELPAIERRLPASVTWAELGPDGRSLMWVDGGRLYRLDEGFAPTLLLDDVLAAWFVANV